MDDEKVIAKGNCDRIGIDGHISHKTFDGRILDEDCPFPTHTEAFEKLTDTLLNSKASVIKSMSEISAVGHRVVQGAEVFSETTLVTDEVIDKIDELAELAPVHNHAHALALRACKKVFDPSVPQAVVFDTAFHQTMPPKAYLYPIPYEYYKKYKIRRYGFHGTSHSYVSKRVAQIMDTPYDKLKTIVCHLGNGASICAVENGKSIDTSMGLTPLAGVAMGTRSGDIDPSIVEVISEKENMNVKEVLNVLNKKSGVLGLSEVSSDFRDITKAIEEGNEVAKNALEVFANTVVRFVGAYVAEMNGVDAIAFTAGVGENNQAVRKMVCEQLGYLSVSLDEKANEKRREEIMISTPDSKVKVFVIPTNEELAIARETLELLS